MPVVPSARRFASKRLEAAARRLLDASTLCAIATVSPGGQAHVNTAYFAWGPAFELVWLSAPEARHSRNVRGRVSAAVAVYDSAQSWDGADRGIQLFGAADEASGRAAEAARELYAARFPVFRGERFPGYRFYRLRPRRLKLVDEGELGGGVFVTAAVRTGGRLEWTRTDVYRN